MLPGMLPKRLCSQCKHLLTETAHAMRRHAKVMETALKLRDTGEPTEEQRRDFPARLVATFEEAQSAWNAYREHLFEHGFLTPDDRISPTP